MYDANRNMRNLENKMKERYDLVGAHEKEQEMFINTVSDGNSNKR